MKASTKYLTALFVLLAVAYLFALVQPTTKAQGAACQGNLVANGNFSNGISSGAMPNPGAVTSWSRAYGTPDVGSGQGCQGTPGFVSMWGNLNTSIGEGLQQSLTTSLVAGKTYLVSLCVRTNYSPGNNQSYARFRMRASAGSLSAAGTANTVWLSGSVTDTVNWTPVNFTWTAPAGGPYSFLTLSVENNSNVNDGALTSSGSFDNVCIREVPPDFTATRACAGAGQPTSFTANAPGATSWNWNFGDGSNPNSTLQNPTHIYANAGTYNVTLCINGTTNCNTKPVTVNASPPAPIIYGPSNTCAGLTATYSVAATSGVSYTWMVSNGTFTGPSTGSSVNVTWNSSGDGQITVTATNKEGCTSRAMMDVSDCNVWLDKCCDGFKLNATAPQPVNIGNNTYTMMPTLTTPNNIIRVAANIINMEQTFPNASCGTGGPVGSHISSATPAISFIPSLPVAFSHEAIWHVPGGGGVNLGGGVVFPFQIKVPPPSASKSCKDVLKFCVKYTFTTVDCRSCEIIRCYSINRQKIIWEPDTGGGGVDVVFVGSVFKITVETETPEGGRPRPVTLAIKPGTGTRGARLRGRTMVEAVNGSATFGDISIDTAGTGYVLVASGPGLREPVESDPFDVAQARQRR